MKNKEFWITINHLRFFADIRDPQTYEPNRTANRILQKITNRTADLSADIRGSVRFGSTRTALFSTKLRSEIEGDRNLPVKINHHAKFVDISTHFNYDISIGLSFNCTYFIWGKCGEEIICYPRETKFKPLLDILVTMNAEILSLKESSYMRNNSAKFV